MILPHPLLIIVSVRNASTASAKCELGPVRERALRQAQPTIYLEKWLSSQNRANRSIQKSALVSFPYSTLKLPFLLQATPNSPTPPQPQQHVCTSPSPPSPPPPLGSALTPPLRIAAPPPPQPQTSCGCPSSVACSCGSSLAVSSFPSLFFSAPMVPI